MAEAGATKREIQKYFAEIREKYAKGDYTELSFRTPLENFITSLDKEYKLTQEPKRTRGFGAPDFKAAYGSRKVGYIETKDLGENLDNVIESDQLKKYMESTNNLILTNYNRFILIRKGSRAYDLTLFSLADLSKSSPHILDEKIENFSDMLHQFFTYELPTITSAEELAKELSRRAKLLKEFATEQLQEDFERNKNNEKTSSIYEFYEGMKELINDISIEDCADAYAQTVTYGLFLARRKCEALDIANAASYIPRNVGIIRKIFMNLSSEEFPSNILWIADEIVDILNAAEVNEILTKMDERGRKDKDPIIFFYEDFLNYYEPERRRRLGVYYTPRPVVNFIVNSVHSILKEHFDRLWGLADPDVNVLDPAIGTGTFFWIAFLVVLNEMRDQEMKGAIPNVIEKHLLKNFYGFELLITPYVISHLKLTDLLQSWHYTLKDEDRIQVYLTNTLDPAVVKETMPFMQEIKEEIRTANEIKLKKQILAIVGNPPYSVSSSNKSEWILKKMEDYKKDLDEKNIQPLDDDYIKFIRFAQWKIDQNGEGVVGFITNNSYLDGVIHRQMRKSLLESFDQIYVLNLHGSSRKGESIPSDVPKDENVFDIQQGVAISIFVKNNKIKEKKVFYADLFGKREDKYGWLDRNRISTVQWQELKPTEPYYFLVPKDFSLLSEYEKFWKITEIFKEWSSGVKTHRDHFVIGFTKEEIIQRMKTFTSNLPDELVAQTLTLKDTESWKLSIAREKIKKKDWERQIYPYAYRPFDARRICYEPSLVDRDRAEVMKHILINGERNVGLATTRMLANPPFVHAFISNSLPDICLVSTKTKETSYFFPLYLYPDNLQKQLLGQGEDKQQRIPNFTDRFLQAIKEPLSRETEPEEIFYYIYAILYSPTYRKRYEEFLKIDFPRIPMPPDYETFKTISNLGKELVELHLLKHPALQKTEICFPKEGSCKIENVRFNEEEKKVYINKEQCFKGISKEVWEYRIGSYQVLEKYLKDRKDRVLSLDEIAHYMETTKAIKLTIELQNEIDAEYTKMANE